MAWNRNSDPLSSKSGNAQKFRKSSPWLYLCSILIVMLGVGLLFLLGQEKKSSTIILRSEDRTNSLATVELAFARQPSVLQKETLEYLPTTAGTTHAVPIKDKSHRAPSTAKKYPRRVIKPHEEPPQRFKYDSDDLIAGFLEIVPGDQVEGGLRFDKIGRDFEMSLSEDVALAEGQDNPANQDLRKWVRDTKSEIQKVMREENKTFGQVMEEQFDQLIELGQYKSSLEQELRQIRTSGEYTADEYKKFIEASNKMLREHGCSELKVPRATFYQVELYRRRKAARDAAESQNY